MTSALQTRTFLFTDIEGSTKLWEAYPEAMRVALARHDSLLRESVDAHGGHVFKTIGDAFCVAFTTASAAAQAAQVAQERLRLEPWPLPIPLKVRMALVTGEVELRDNDYFGRAVNRVARFLSLGSGSQVLVAPSTQQQLPPTFALTNLGYHHIKDLPQPEQVYQLDYTGCPTNLPPLRSLAVGIQNQPQQLTAFVGREPELQGWPALFREQTRRLFTVTGFGGVGKTRIAMRLGELLLRDFADGVWWCDLEQATTVDEALGLLSLALRLPLQPTPGVREQLFAHTKNRHCLVILDNVEQVQGGPALIRDLLAETQDLVCLVTSRRTLELRGEVVLELPPLSLTESVALFVERATEGRPDFAFTEENRAEMQELCRRLEGVPLAIELAATRIVGMSPGQILQRLSERFRLLQTRSQELNERQRALRGAIDWSYNLLSDDDRAVLAQLSVFVGGFTLEEAEAVCEAFDVFESVLELRKHSFFRLEPDAQRFVMLDSIREYAQEKLEQTPDQGRATRSRHAQSYLALSRARIAQVRTPIEVQALTELQRGEGNLQAACDWAQRTQQHDLAAEFCWILGVLRQRQGFSRSAVERIEAGLAILSPSSPPVLRGRLLLERAGLHYDFNEPEACITYTDQARTLFLALGDERGQARAENLWGQACVLQRDFSQAILHLTQAQQLFTQLGDQIGVAIALNNHALALRRDTAPQGLATRREKAEQLLTEALRLRRALEDRRGLAETLNNLGVLAFEQERYAVSWDYYREALTFELELHNRRGIGVTLANLGEVAALLNQPEQGVRLLITAVQILEEAASPHASGVAGMLATQRDEVGWSSEQVTHAQNELQDLPISERCHWPFRV